MTLDEQIPSLTLRLQDRVYTQCVKHRRNLLLYGPSASGKSYATSQLRRLFASRNIYCVNVNMAREVPMAEANDEVWLKDCVLILEEIPRSWSEEFAWLTEFEAALRVIRARVDEKNKHKVWGGIQVIGEQWCTDDSVESRLPAGVLKETFCESDTIRLPSMVVLISPEHKHRVARFRRWVYFCVKLLKWRKRATEVVCHPERMKERGVFDMVD